MPKYYCDYCDTYLTHDSPSVRKTHCQGRKHKDNVKFYYQKWMEEQAQHLIDATTAAFKAGKIAVPGKPGLIPTGVPPLGPNGLAARPPPPPGAMMGPPGMPPHPGMSAMMMGPHGPMPPMMGMRHAPPMMGAMVPMGPMSHIRPPPMMTGPGPMATIKK
ncbi:U1 small nuclear ribonucleoprotein C [Cimex lectularius]|uniref:U1 small nuclear ribonucleoprotein C n=1 Tax=Cimex lectularius TaxID=79782 RepID=A0A8I6RFW4_CIMLE|nr:U1 small nuclear ribonucleoprotein C [Cimex lectularius]